VPNNSLPRHCACAISQSLSYACVYLFLRLGLGLGLIISTCGANLVLRHIWHDTGTSAYWSACRTIAAGSGRNGIEAVAGAASDAFARCPHRRYAPDRTAITTLIPCYDTRCRCDDVDLLVISYNGTPRPFAKYCGSRVPPVTMSTDHAAELLFFSRPSSYTSTASSPYWQSESSAAVGFRAHFAFVSGQKYDVILNSHFHEAIHKSASIFPGLLNRSSPNFYTI